MIRLNTTDPHEGTLHDLMPDLTPMLDILFILLVFFMLTAGVVFQALDLTLPSSTAEPLPATYDAKHIMLEIHEKVYVVDGQEIKDFNQLRQTLTVTIKQKPTHELVVAGHKDISIERLLQVLTFLQSQGVEAANILMQKDNTE